VPVRADEGQPASVEIEPIGLVGIQDFEGNPARQKWGALPPGQAEGVYPAAESAGGVSPFKSVRGDSS